MLSSDPAPNVYGTGSRLSGSATRKMNPDVCTFLSKVLSGRWMDSINNIREIYENKKVQPRGNIEIISISDKSNKDKLSISCKLQLFGKYIYIYISH